MKRYLLFLCNQTCRTEFRKKKNNNNKQSKKNKNKQKQNKADNYAVKSITTYSKVQSCPGVLYSRYLFKFVFHLNYPQTSFPALRRTT